MFSFFNSEKPAVKVIDKVWMYKHSKMKACANMYELESDCLFVAWFEETYKELKQVIQFADDSSNFELAQNITTTKTQNRMVVFVEHYPLASVEQQLFAKLNLIEVPVLSSLDEPFFQKFGGERTIELMKKLGMDENEIIGHSLVSKSISNAQRSIERKIFTDIKSRSQQEWFSANLK
jgi:hypothetical protein